MKIIKLSAIDSTNSFLKGLVSNSQVQDFTVVTAQEQTNGRGQMHTKWLSDSGKNLILSVFFEFENLMISNQKFLNYAISLSIYDVLQSYKLPQLCIKWPNDIMSENTKIAGILIENYMRNGLIYGSVVGIGLNVNQDSFPLDITGASSMALKMSQKFSLDEVLERVLDRMSHYVTQLKSSEFQMLEEYYLDRLYKKNVPSMFKTSQNVLFMGKIIGVSSSGKLQIELSDETLQEFALKEVSFA